MQRLEVPKEEWPTNVDGTGFWLLEKWRRTSAFCCIDIHSDDGFVWDVYWRYSYSSNIDEKHLRHSVRRSFMNFDEAIYASATAACGIDGTNRVFSSEVMTKYAHQPEAVVDSILKKVSLHFEKTIHRPRSSDIGPA